ncbi:patatin-like phospholipase-domain-containing protein [Echria macrotheca]|uniref:Patatin-like phospholipase-domain-containing protein n=1 Tax=Echria macrotheca TaxID=438768 RepID=A0AAJ0F9T8_9PEZI|nr:patatin-like phospholipase-domain-containing protein [Echria macrotheca]
MADTANSTSSAASLPQPTSALRNSRSAPKRVRTRVSIAIPERPPIGNDVTAAPASGTTTKMTSPNLRVKTTPWAKSLILTLDGGGIRGYSSLIILRALMTEIAHIETSLDPKALSSAHTDRIDPDSIPDHVLRKNQYLPCHYFDYIAGTSVGGLIAIMLGMLGKSVDDCIAEFQRQHKAIPLPNDIPVVTIDLPLLHRRSTWPTRRTRAFFETFAKFSVTSTAKARPNSYSPNPTTPSTATTQHDETASTATTDSAEFRKDSLQCQTLAWCTEVEEHRARRPYAFCTFKDEGSESPEQLVSIPEVAKAITTPSSSAFKPFKLGSGQFVDGSKQIRDPTLEVLKELTDLLSEPGEPPIDLLLSVGTDENQAWFYEKLRRPSSSAVSASSSLSQADITKEEGRSYVHYHRFQVTDIKLGLRKKYYLREIEEATEKWLATDDQRDKIRRYAEMLVEKRRARAATTRWETFALGVRYYCFHDECQSVDRAFDGRGEFHEHLDRKHRLMKEAAKGDLDVEKELDKGRRFGCT